MRQAKPTAGKAALGVGAAVLGVGAAALLVFQEVETVLQARSLPSPWTVVVSQALSGQRASDSPGKLLVTMRCSTCLSLPATSCNAGYLTLPR